MAYICLVSIHPTINWENTCKQNGCHALLISNYSIASKCLLVHKCDIALERFRSYYSSHLFNRTTVLWPLNIANPEIALTYFLPHYNILWGPHVFSQRWPYCIISTCIQWLKQSHYV